MDLEAKWIAVLILLNILKLTSQQGFSRIWTLLILLAFVQFRNSGAISERDQRNGISFRGIIKCAFLAQSLSRSMRRDCLLEPVGACITDFFNQKVICSSSKGSSDPTVPEKLVYKLLSDICLVNEIHVQPFQDGLQIGGPIFSSRAVRFRMGHPKFPLQSERDYSDKSVYGPKWATDNVMWTYTSPEFPMAHVSSLQKFKLPAPAFCIGGFLQVELLGRVQKQKMDGLYYIWFAPCISDVEVVGRTLRPQFDIEILDSSGKCSLKYYPTASGRTSAGALKCSGDGISKKIKDWMLSKLNGPEDSDDDYPTASGRASAGAQRCWCDAGSKLIKDLMGSALDDLEDSDDDYPTASGRTSAGADTFRRLIKDWTRSALDDSESSDDSDYEYPLFVIPEILY